MADINGSDLNQMAERFEGESVLVTGGSGFIGSHLVEALAAGGAKVTVLDNLQAGRWDNLESVRGRVECVNADVRDASDVQRLIAGACPRYVFHLAANASVPGSVQGPAYDFEANALGTFVVLNALRLVGGCENVVAASSGAVYGEPVSFPIREEDPLAPISPYGASKLCTEVSCRMFHRVYDMRVTIARLFNAYGPRMARFVVLDFLRKLARDPTRLEVLGTGKQVRDFTYVADTVQGLLRLALRGIPGEAYNVSSGVNHSVTELAHRLIAVRGLAGKTEIAYTGTSWVGDAQRWEVSIDKLRGIGYAPAFTLDDGLRQTKEWFDGQDRKG